MGPKIYTVREANQLIPELEQLFQELDSVRASLKQIKAKTDLIEMLWGDEVASEQNPDHREYQHYVEELEKAKSQFEATTKKFVDHECMLKDLEQGLVDFYGVIDGRLVLLCWKRGESAIEYWHHIEDGYAGRQPIPIAKGAN